MHFVLTGLNHKTAPLNLREKIAVRTGKLAEALQTLKAYLDNGLIISTCNRTEIYTVTLDPTQAFEKIITYLKERAGSDESQLLKSIYSWEDADAVKHLFRVAAGLESMVVGEFEVLGQVRQALEAAENGNMVGAPLRHIFQKAIHAGRRVRIETSISHSALSVSSIAVEMISRLVPRVSDCNLLVIGTGEAGRLVAKVAKEKGISRIAIIGRYQERVQALAAELNALPVDSHHVVDELGSADVVVTCSGAPHWALDVARVKTALLKRHERRLLIIDIAIPRNVEPEVGQVQGVTLCNIDNLMDISNQNRKSREADIHKAEQILDQELYEFHLWWQTQSVKPVINALIDKAEKIRSEQLSLTLKKLPPLTKEQNEYLEAMTRSIINKILHDPICYLKCPGEGRHADIIKECFRLEG